MTVDVQQFQQARAPRKRQLRNFLLDPRFQLKYTGMVIAVTIFVAAVLGFFAYRYSTGQTEMMTLMQMERSVDLSPETAAYLQQEAAAEDRRVLAGILGGVLFMTFALGLTGIWVTHKLVGPAYKIKSLLRAVQEGDLSLNNSGLRKGDELQDVFEAYAAMLESLRARQALDA
jgi:methyl-accepting chemotaxis protein